MPLAEKIYELGETFYVPDFVVEVADERLPDPVVHDVLEVKYTDNVEEIDSFEITLNNWDAEARRPKYEPAFDPELAGLFDPGAEIEIRMGYLGNLRRVLTGVITSLEPNFSESGPFTLAVRGLNQLHSFRAEQHTFAWEKKTDSEIARDLGNRPVSKGKPGLGIRVVTASSDDEPEEPYVFMDNQYDIVFLLNRARKRGYELVLRVDDDGEHLYFGPSESRAQAPAPYLLEWGKSLVRFRPTLSTATQVSEVEVRGWDRRKNRKIVGKASLLKGVKGAERSRLEQISQAFNQRREIVTDRPVHTRQQAKNLAQRILDDRSKEMVKASGAVVGLPDLRAGRSVAVVGVGERFDGQYYVTETTHTIGDGGYQTEFKARREGPPDMSLTGGGA